MERRCRNWKARKVFNKDNVVIDRSEEVKIKLDLKGVKETDFDDSNVLVLPSKKRKTKVQGSDAPQKKKLTKKQRRLLEKVIERREKKAKRADLLSSLEKVQIPVDELSKFVSVSDMQSNRVRESQVDVSVASGIRIDSTSRGWRKRKLPIKQQDEEMKEESDESDIHTSDMSSDEEDETKPDTKANVEAISEANAEENMETNTETNSKTSDIVDVVRSLSVERLNANSTSTRRSDAVSGQLKSNIVNTCEELKKTRVDSFQPGSASKVLNKKFVSVKRTRAIEDQRSKLPVVMEEQIVMEKINDNPVVIVCGETGSGKTTQIPQFLYEAGYADGGIIGVTQPRRVAAICMSKRVAEELNLTQREVSYQIRYEGNTTDDTKIKFMTDGVLLKEVQNDFLLSRYRVIVLDEAHERSVYTDILIGLLSRIVPLRHKKGVPLKLIIMSATLRVTDFTENRNLFKSVPPVIQIDSRQFPVTVHFNRHTTEDYLEEAFKKVCKIHKKLPEGGILVFVTSQQEVLTLCRRLKKTFKTGLEKCSDTKGHKLNGAVKQKSSKKKKKLENKAIQEVPTIDLDNYSAYPQDEEDDTVVDQNDSETEQDPLTNPDDDGEDSDAEGTGLMYSCQPMHVLPMFSLLSAEKQAKVFEGAPDGCRLCVISTNVAETSLTIPGIKYVVDTGKEKTKVYDKVTGVSTFQVTWISQASANQRTGRAGRIGPGHAYRLYSSAVFSDFAKHTEPEICRRPVEDVILQMKDMGIDHVVNFPFPTPPDVVSLEAAEKLLVSLGALSLPQESSSLNPVKSKISEKSCYKITPLGKTMAQFPVAPRYAKMLALSNQHGILSYVIVLVSALSVQELFVDINNTAPDLEEDSKDARNDNKRKHSHIRKQWAGIGNSLLLGDMMMLLKAVGACEYEGCSPEFCEANGLRYKALLEVRKLRKHLTNTVNLVYPESGIILQPQMKPPTDEQAKLIRQVVLMGLADHVARKIPVPSTCEASEKKKLNLAYQDMSLVDPVYIHPSSVLYKTRHEFVIYHILEETSKLYMKGVAVVEADWLPLYAPSHCQFSAPLLDNPPRYDVSSGCVMCNIKSKYGPQQWEMPEVEVNFPKNGDCMRWFARFLLEGKVIDGLRTYSETLLLSPYTLVKNWAHLQPKTTRLLNALASEKVYCRDELLAVWGKNPNYLLKELKEWIPESLHDKLIASWPPVKL